MTDPQPLSEVDLLVWAVVLKYRARQQLAGLRFVLMPFPDCPACHETVHTVNRISQEQALSLEARLTLLPCGHVFTADDDDLYRLRDHIHDLVDRVTGADRSDDPDDRSWTLDDIIRAAHARLAPPQPLDVPHSSHEGPDGGAESRGDDSSAQAAAATGWTQLEARAFNAVLKPDMDALHNRAEDNWGMLKLMERDRDDWGDRHRAIADRLDRARQLHRENCLLATGKVKRTAFTCGMCDALDPPTATQATDNHDDGPSVRDCAEADRRWDLEKAGE